MSQTETTGWRELAGELYDEIIVPLAEDRASEGRSYFPRGGDPAATTYFTPCDSRTMEISPFGTRTTSADDIVSVLDGLWSNDGDTELASLGPRMRAISEALANEETLNDGTVDVLCYTLF